MSAAEKPASRRESAEKPPESVRGREREREGERENK
jgi:hypothetical protein